MGERDDDDGGGWCLVSATATASATTTRAIIIRRESYSRSRFSHENRRPNWRRCVELMRGRDGDCSRLHVPDFFRRCVELDPWSFFPRRFQFCNFPLLFIVQSVDINFYDFILGREKISIWTFMSRFIYIYIYWGFILIVCIILYLGLLMFNFSREKERKRDGELSSLE